MLASPSTTSHCTYVATFWNVYQRPDWWTTRLLIWRYPWRSTFSTLDGSVCLLDNLFSISDLDRLNHLSVNNWDVSWGSFNPSCIFALYLLEGSWPSKVGKLLAYNQFTREVGGVFQGINSSSQALAPSGVIAIYPNSLFFQVGQ